MSQKSKLSIDYYFIRFTEALKILTLKDIAK